MPVNTRAEVHVPLADGQQALESGKPANTQPGVTYKGTTNGDAVYEVGSGSYRFLAATVDATSVDTPGQPAPSPRRSRSTRRTRRPSARSRPGVAKDYTGDADRRGHEHRRRCHADRPRPERHRPGHLVNGGFALAQPLQVEGKPVAGASNPTPLKSWTGPVSNDPLTLALKQSIAANDAAAHRQLQQDADVHAEHYGSVEADGSPPWPRSAWPRRPVP